MADIRPKTDKLILRFPVEVEQISKNEIAVPMVAVDAEVCSARFEQIAHDTLGARDGHILLTDIADFANRQMILRQII